MDEKVRLCICVSSDLDCIDPLSDACLSFISLVPTIIIGALYANVAGKYIFRRVMGGSRHAHSHSVVGWGSWIGIIVILWVLAWVLGETIPSMGDFLSIMSAAFDSFFGYIFWAGAWFELNRGRYFSSARQTALFFINVVM